MNIREAVIKSLTTVGIDFDLTGKDDIDLREYIENSLLFVNFVIELEENLNFELPYEMLIQDSFSSLNQFCQQLEIFCVSSNKQSDERG